jgi:hypothetical protein
VGQGLYSTNDYDYAKVCRVINQHPFGRSPGQLDKLGLSYVGLKRLNKDDLIFRKRNIIKNYSKEEFDQYINYRLYLSKARAFNKSDV